MPDRLPIAREIPLWLRYGAIVPILALATFATIAIGAIARPTPFMLYFAAAVSATFVGGIGAGGLTVAAALVLIHLVVAPAIGIPPVGGVASVAFIAVCGSIVMLTDWALRNARIERARRAWSDVTLQSIGDAVMVTDAQGRVLTMNPVAEQLTGWSREEAYEQPIVKVFEIVNQETRAPVENPVDRVWREGKVAGLANHTVLIARDGREIPIDDSGAPIWSEDRHVVGAVLVFRDITKRYEAEKERTALLKSEQGARLEAQAANRAKDEFLAVLSHELRTPLHAILGWSNIVAANATTPEARRGIEVIERNARRQAALIEEMLDMSRIVSGKLALEFVPVDLASVVEAAIDTVRPMAEAKQLEIEVRGHCGGPVLGDADRLQQIVWNLLSNAIKFTPSGGKIEIAMDRHGAVCTITVRDSGEGITFDFLPHVFDRFGQEGRGTTRRFGGLGLGLTIVRHLVEMHGGSVTAASDGPGQGATFTLRLPLAGAERPLTIRRQAPDAVAAPQLSGIRVLAVDDEPDARDFVAEVLRRAGAEVRTAASTEEAIQFLAQGASDLLIVDISMPDRDGYTLLRMVREAGHDLPAIALTAHSSGDHRIRALVAGFAQHISKPVEPAELQLAVAMAVSERRSRV